MISIHLQAVINIMYLLARLTQQVWFSATANKNHRENTSNLVSMETEGNIPSLFLDGSFIISISEKRYFKVIETIKYSQLFIAVEIESMGLQCFSGPADFSGKKRGYW